MVRAGVFIGVDHSGTLTRLNDAAAGAKRMHEWALAQGMPDKTHAKLITDAGGDKVVPAQIEDAIEQLTRGAGVDQLIVYFAGHGVNIARSEYWLLSEAPARTSAAVNVSGSAELARYGGIRHVVMISDACRVAAEGIQAGSVRGVDIFPADPPGDKARPVDQFFACYLGKTAAELKDATAAAGNYAALYTNALLDALKGEREDVLEPGDGPGDIARYVKIRRLQTYLESEVPLRVKARNLEKKVNQNPDAIITSDATWLARITDVRQPPKQTVRSRVRGVLRGTTSYTLGKVFNLPRVDRQLLMEPPQTLVAVAQQLVRSAAQGDERNFRKQLLLTSIARVPGAEELAETTESLATPFGPDHFETECGIKVRGVRVLELLAPRVGAQMLGEAGNLIRITGLKSPASVLLRFEGDICTVVPAIPGFIAALTFDEGELIDVAYEPSVANFRWNKYEERASEVRSLRAVAASSSRHGRFRLDQEDAIKLAEKMQYAKGVDPTLAVYAAYAYHDLQVIERIHEMSRYLQQDIGATFFDLALLGRTLINKSITPDDAIVPFVPLLSQGWALLKAHRVKLHPALNGIETTMRDSLWSLFDRDGLEKLKRVILTTEVR